MTTRHQEAWFLIFVVLGAMFILAIANTIARLT